MGRCQGKGPGLRSAAVRGNELGRVGGEWREHERDVEGRDFEAVPDIGENVDHWVREQQNETSAHAFPEMQSDR